MGWRPRGQAFQQTKADELLFVGPLSVLHRICELGVKPLRAEMERLHHGYRHIKFVWVTGVEIKTEEVA
jgi:hypothetical protein